MPLMPMPPIPMKCRCWGLKNIFNMYCFELVAVMSMTTRGRYRLFHHLGRPPRRAGMSEGSRLLAHVFQDARLRAQFCDFLEEPAAVHLRVENQPSRAEFGERFGVAELVLIGRGGQRNQDGRLARGC